MSLHTEAHTTQAHTTHTQTHRQTQTQTHTHTRTAHLEEEAEEEIDDGQTDEDPAERHGRRQRHLAAEKGQLIRHVIHNIQRMQDRHGTNLNPTGERA